MKIKYWTGTETIEVDVAVGVAAAYRESLREEWRSDRRAERHQAAISLTQMEDENGYQLVGLSTGDIADEMIEREEEDERRTKLSTVMSELTPEQRRLVAMLRKGMSVTDIAVKLGVGKTAVSNMRIRIQEKIKKVLK